MNEEARGGGVSRLPLAPAQKAAVDAGQFVRIELPEALAVARWITTKSVLVGRAEGRVRAYANVCRHQAVPLDLVMEEETDASAAPLPAPLTDDGAMLICLRHGALYRLADGLCTEGPCVGQRLHEVEVEAGEQIVLTLRPVVDSR